MIDIESTILEPPRDIIVPTPDLSTVQSLYDQGKMLQAYTASQSLGPLTKWRGPTARVMAGRLAMNLGSHRLGTIFHILAHRENPDDDTVRYYFARALMDRRGPLVARDWMIRTGLSDNADSETRADWLGQLAAIAITFRDFDAAESLLDQADRHAPDRPWLCVERARLWEAEDRYDRALAAARRSLEIRPWFRPGVQSTAHILQILDRDDEALALLTEASDKLESGPVVWQLVNLQEELKLAREAQQSLQRLEPLLPLLDKYYAKALAALKSSVAYQSGDTAATIQFARQSKNDFLLKIADRLEQPAAPNARRVLLDVPFVRQHHMTCAPATLSAISRFWSMPADHLALVEEICYDGTPAFSERDWANKSGWITREFTVTPAPALALIGRGIPFTLTTSETTSAHLQAVIGYDSFRNTLLVRDPFRYYHGEFHLELALERYASTGPRGMAMVPAEKSHLLEDIILPDAELYDRLFDLQAALRRHDRPAAAAVLDQMRADSPNHRLVLSARQAMAAYDSDTVASLEVIEQLLAQFPKDGQLKLARMSLLTTLGRRDEQRAMLDEICKDGKCESVFLLRQANELRADARNTPQAIALLKKILRRNPTDGAGLHALANIHWAKFERPQALELYRLASCVNDKQEFPAESYFRASRYLKKTDDALTLLKNRFKRYAKRSSLPGRTLFFAYETLDRPREGIAILQEARRLRPDDGELALFAADVQARYGDLAQAKILLESATGKTHRNDWLRRAAQIAQFSDDRAQALSLWRHVIDSEPLAMDGQSSVTRLIAETQSPAAAVNHLAAMCERFPHYHPLARLRVEWLHDIGAAAQEPAIRALLEKHPTDSWARRELALSLCAQNKLEEAAECAQLALAADPNAPASHYVNARVLWRQHRLEESRESLRAAIRLSVDYQPAVTELIDSCSTRADRRTALKFIYDELVRQPIFGDGLLTYRNVARDTLERPELLAILREALAARPDLWHAWSAIICQLLDMGEIKEASDLAKQALDRFPLLPRLWLDSSIVSRNNRDPDGEINALQEALRLSPTWSFASRMLSDALIRRGDLQMAIDALNRAITRDPLDAQNLASLADVLWRDDKKQEAVDRAKQAVLLEPGLNRTWDSLRSWMEKLGQKEQAVALARELTTRRAGEARSWLTLAEILSGPESLDERLAACDKAAQLDPRSIRAADLKATILSEAKKFDEAESACLPPILAAEQPLALRGRLAWIHHQRGDKEKAIDQITALVTEDPAYYWGWWNLCAWLFDGKDNPKFLQASLDFVKNFPRDTSALLGLADAQKRSNDRAGAKQTLTRLVDLHPDHSEALYRLFDIQLAESDFAAAEKTLAAIKRHHPGEWAKQREAALACARSETPKARTILQDLGGSFKEDPRPMLEALKSMDTARMAATANEVIAQIASVPDADQGLTELWMRRTLELRNFSAAQKILKKFPKGSDAWCTTAIPYIEALAHRKNDSTIARFIWWNKSILRAHTGTWGMVGFAHLQRRKYSKAARWLSDYKQRKDARPWMLLNLAIALGSTGNDKKAREVSEFAMTLKSDQTTPRHTIRLALSDALAGQTSPYTLAFHDLNLTKMSDSDQFLASLTTALLSVIHSDETARSEVFKNSKTTLTAACAKLPHKKRSPYLRRAYKQTLFRLAKSTGGLKNHLWAWTRYLLA